LFDAANCLKKLPNIGRTILYFWLQGVHDCPRESRIDIWTPLHEVSWSGCVMVQRGPPIEDFSLPRVLKAAHAVAGDTKGEDIHTLIR